MLLVLPKHRKWNSSGTTTHKCAPQSEDLRGAGEPSDTNRHSKRNCDETAVNASPEEIHANLRERAGVRTNASPELDGYFDV
jgi:hypothetical protein